MGQLFDRAGRLIRAELNSRKFEEAVSAEESLGEAAALLAGGAIAGASIGKVGVLAGGTGYSLGAVPLAAIGALTGAALYEALRSIFEGDTSSVNAAATGTAAGVATSAAIGGVGVATGGSAIGAGMAAMAAGGAVVGLGLVGINRLLQQGLDPEKLLDQAIKQMEADLQNARQPIAEVLAAQKQLQQHCRQTQAQIEHWKLQAKLALQKGEEDLARKALVEKREYSQTLSRLEAQLSQEPDSVKSLKQKLSLLQAKIAEAKLLRTSLKIQIATARANGQLQRPMSSFECMEEKVQQMEARSQAAMELVGSRPGDQFFFMTVDDIDDELAAMKQQLLGTAPNRGQLLSSTLADTTPQDAAVDAELEALKKQIDQL